MDSSNWLTDFIRPKIKALVDTADARDDLWTSCKSCNTMLHFRQMQDSLHVCNECGHHHAIPAEERLKALFDGGLFTRAELPEVNQDPLNFRDSKRYTERIKDARRKTDEDDAIIVGHGTIGGNKTVIACFNFAFMGGSMGMAVGEGILTAARLAVMQRAALIIVPSSGGARMQESVLSLMQMSRTTIAIQMVKEAHLPYIVLLAHPTTGGVSASFAMLGDIHIAEPGSMIGFAGRRVIEQTVREKLPDDFQTAEYLKEHGMVDMVLPRAEQRQTLSTLLGMMMHKKLDSSDANPSHQTPPQPDGDSDISESQV